MSNYTRVKTPIKEEQLFGASLTTVADLVARWQLKPEGNGKWSGAHPTGDGATKDGFILCPEGNAFTNGGAKYTSRQVAELAGIDPANYEPCATFAASNGHTPPSSAPTPKKRLQSPQNGNGAPNAKSGEAPFDWKGAQTFDYCDESGAALFQVGRIGDGAAKQIRQRRPDARGGWLYSLGDVRRVLWLLPAVLTAKTVYICEGEKSAGALNAALEEAGLLGNHVATTNPQGAGKWRDEFCASLGEKWVCVLPDFDDVGDNHGAAVCASIQASGRAKSVKRVDLPNLPAKGDVADFLNAGGTVAELVDLMEAAPVWEPKTEPKAPSKLIRIGDLHKRPAPKWLIQRFLMAGTTSLFTADSGSYKSFIALHIAYCVAHGLSFFGRGVQRGAVVYVAGEGGDGLRARSIAWDTHHDRESPENLFVWESAVQIANAGEVAAFLLELEQEGVKPSAIIFDTLNRCAEGLDENSARDMGLFCGGLERIKRATGAHVGVVHHHNANGKSRGSTALPGAFDTRFSAEREADTVTLRCQKQKDGAEEFEAFALAARVVEIGELDEYGDAITSLVLEPSDKLPAPETAQGAKGAKEQKSAAILAELVRLQANATDGAKISKTDWEEAVLKAGICSRSTFHSRVKELETAGRWYWWKGDCRLENAGASPTSPTSPTSPILDVLDATETEKSKTSDKSKIP